MPFRITPTVHAVPRQTLRPFLLRNERIAVDIAGFGKHLGTLLGLDGLLSDALQVPVLVLVEDAVSVGVHRTELPLIHQKIALVIVRLDDAAMVATPLRVEDIDEVVVEFGLIQLLAGAVAALASWRAASRGFLLPTAVGLNVGTPAYRTVRQRHSLGEKLSFLKVLRETKGRITWGVTHQQKPVSG